MRVPHKARRWMLLLVLLVVLASAWAFFSRIQSPMPQPPLVDLDGADPAVVALIEPALNQVLLTPRDPQAWGTLGMVLRAHDYNPEAVECFSQAQHLNGNEPRWPYFQGTALTSLDPPAAASQPWCAGSL